jgi:Ca2+-binding EF-hand superfamily protein
MFDKDRTQYVSVNDL